MRFVAAIDTRFYGVRYLQGALVDVSDWSRKQILQYLDRGLIAPADVNGQAIGDIDLSALRDVSDAAATEGQILVRTGGQWVPSSPSFSADIPDATTTAKGKLKLAGDLAGTADSPTVPGLAGKEASGTAAGLLGAHVAASDPHPVYTTGAELSTAISAHTGAADPHPQYAFDADVTAALAAHTAAADPHPVYLTQAEGDGRYAALGSGGGGGASLPDGTGQEGKFLRRVPTGTPTLVSTAGITATASSQLSGYPPSLAFDNGGTAPESCWASSISPGSAWLQVQYPVAHTVVQYKIAGRPSAQIYQNLTGWTLKGSNDGTSWTTLHSVSGLFWAAFEVKTFTVSSPGSYTYYRLDNTTSSSSDYWCVQEWMNYEAVYSATATEWVLPSLAGLADVDVSTPPTDGQLLKWNAASSKWKPAADIVGGGGGGGSGGGVILLEHGTSVPPGTPSGLIVFEKAETVIEWDFRGVSTLPGGWYADSGVSSLSYGPTGVTYTSPYGTRNGLYNNLTIPDKCVFDINIVSISSTGTMFGAQMIDGGINGMASVWYNAPNNNLLVRGSGAVYASQFQTGAASPSFPSWLRLRKDGTNYYASSSVDGSSYTAETAAINYGNAVSMLGIGNFFNTATVTIAKARLAGSAGSGLPKGWWDGTAIQPLA